MQVVPRPSLRPSSRGLTNNRSGVADQTASGHFAGGNLLWRVERRRRNFTTGPSPTGPQVLHQRDQRRIHGPSPRSIASPITHVASLAQSTVSHPRRRASPEHGLRIVSGFANQTLRVLSSNRILLPHLLSMRPLPEMDVLKLSSNSFLLRLRRRVDQEGHRIGRWLRSIGNGTIHPTLPSPMSSTPPTKSFPRPSVINGDYVHHHGD
jgi:hypothetical protein